jgi:hypothetical protein
MERCEKEWMPTLKDLISLPGEQCAARLWSDSVDKIGAQFGVSPKRLCEYNNMTNCNALSFRCSALAIPVH